MSLIEQRLARIDLNLLVSLSVLLKERNVSRAAEILFLSQSAMSRTLQRLRELFDDPLFHRTAAGIIPTDKALTLEKILPDILESLNNVIQKEDFNPLECDHHFTISLPSLMSNMVILPLFKQLKQQAPHITFSEYPAKTSPLELLETGSLDFAIHVVNKIPAIYSSTSLGKAHVMILARKSHPLTKKKSVTLEDCLSYDYLELIVENESNIKFKSPAKLLLDKRNLKHNVVFSSSQLSLILDILKSTDCLLICMTALLKSPQITEYFQPIYQLELADNEQVEFFLIEHMRSKNSLSHRWFKEQLLHSIKPLFL